MGEGGKTKMPDGINNLSREISDDDIWKPFIANSRKTFLEYLAHIRDEFVSILITGKNGKEENYLGIFADIALSDIGTWFIRLDTSDVNGIIKEIIFDANLLKSIWVYKKKKMTKQKKAELRDKYGLGYPPK